MAASRIVSLVPSGTEIVHALGLTGSLVARSHECDFPAEIQGRPVCTRCRLPSDGSTSREIDQAVQAHLESGSSLYEVITEQIQAVRPDLILTQSQCAVCAIDKQEVLRTLGEAGTQAPPRVLELSAQSLKGLWEDIPHVAEACGRPEQGKAVVKTLKNRVVDIIQETSQLTQPRKVVALEWLDPLMTAGHWIPELIELAGGKELLGTAGQPSRRTSGTELTSASPEALLLMPCGMPLDRVTEEARRLLASPDGQSIQATQKGKIYAFDGNAYFNRPGPRLVDSLEILAEVLHPDRFEAHYRDSAWTCLP